MATEIEQRRDEVLALFRAAWQPALASVGINITKQEADKLVVYSMIDGDGQPNANTKRTPWCRVTLDFTDGVPTSISGRRYKVIGNLTIQCFVDLQQTSDAGGRVQALVGFLVEVFRDYRGKTNFSRVYAATRLPSGNFAACDAKADFHYHQVRKRSDG